MDVPIDVTFHSDPLSTPLPFYFSGVNFTAHAWSLATFNPPSYALLVGVYVELVY